MPTTVAVAEWSIILFMRRNELQEAKIGIAKKKTEPLCCGRIEPVDSRIHPSEPAGIPPVGLNLGRERICGGAQKTVGAGSSSAGVGDKMGRYRRSLRIYK